MTPFEDFFENEFWPEVHAVTSGPVFTNGHTIDQASWDRKAAYLLFRERNPAPQTVEDLFG